MSEREADPAVDAAPAKRGRSKPISITVIALAAVVALAAATQSWLEIRLVEGAAAVSHLSVTGQKLNPSLSPIALAVLAAALVLTIAGPVFRRVLGGLLVLLGLGVAALGVLALTDPHVEPNAAVAEVTGIAGAAQYGLIRSTDITAWPMIVAIAGTIVAIAGVAVLLLSGSWRTGGRKYEAQGAREVGGAAVAVDDGPDRIAEWDALSDGDDPSDEPR